MDANGRGLVRIRLWVQMALAAASAALLVATLISQDWIEAIFGVDPDKGDGTLERAIVAVLTMATVLTAASARRQWQRLRSA
jgi:hypothetical protein